VTPADGVQSVEKLTVGSEVKGNVVRVNKLSVDVDIGIKGILANYHISQINSDRDVKIENMFSVGDEVTARILQARLGGPKKWLGLARLDHPAFEKKTLSSFSVGQDVSGKLLHKGPRFTLFDIGAMRPATAQSSLFADEAKDGDIYELKVAIVKDFDIRVTPA